jgi:hypothetical protein
MKIRILPVLKRYYNLYNAVRARIAFGFESYFPAVQNELRPPALHQTNYLSTVPNRSDFHGGDLKLLLRFNKAVRPWYFKIQRAGIRDPLTEINQLNFRLS